VREEVSREEAQKRIEALNEPYKLEILERIKEEPITIYHIGNCYCLLFVAEYWLVDLCTDRQICWVMQEKSGGICVLALMLRLLAKYKGRLLSSSLLLVLTGKVMRKIRCYKEYMGLHGRVKIN
jgi:hypothetical protein